MNNFTIERSSAAPHIALGRIKKLEPLSKHGKVDGPTDRHKVRPPHGSARRWQSLFASFLRRS